MAHQTATLHPDPTGKRGDRRSAFAAMAGAAMLCALGVATANGREPALSPIFFTAGASLHTPAGGNNVSTGYGTRFGFSFPLSLPAGDIVLPGEWGLTLRTASLRLDGPFDRTVFTDLQVPVLFHGGLAAWKPFEILAVWTPAYTLNLASTASNGGLDQGTEDLRTRFNMGFGAGGQASYAGFRIRAYGAYNIFPPFRGSEATTTDWVMEFVAPLVWSHRSTPNTPSGK